MSFGCVLAINNHWLMTEFLNDFFCELAINNHWVITEPLNDIYLWTGH